MIKTIGAAVLNDKGQILPYTVQSTKEQCRMNAEKFFPAWEKMKELGAKVVQVEITTIDKLIKLADIKASIRHDNYCPIGCGDCCKYWWMVEDLTDGKEITSDPGGNCPHLKEDGCELPRDDRPRDCVHHLCLRAEEELYSQAEDWNNEK